MPAENLIGEEGKGFRYILVGMNAERILIAAECIGDAKWFIDKATAYAKERERVRPADRPEPGRAVSDRARLHADARRRADGARGGALYEAGEDCGAEANMAKQLAAEASWAAADMCVQTHGGFGFAEEFDIERKFRETRLYQVAPISTNLILSYLAEHVLGSAAVVLNWTRCAGLSPLKASSSSRSNRRWPRRCARAGSPTPARASSRSSGRRAISRAATTTLVHGECSYFVWLNRGKESVVLDLAKRRRQGAARGDARQGRRVRAEPQARRGRASSASPIERLRARPSAADRLLDLGLRRRRPLRRSARPTTC